jgi:hypothetical protein
MANPTYKLIASQVVGSGGASSITFSSIPQTYTDLQVVASARSTRTAASGDGLDMYFITSGGTLTTGYTYKAVQTDSTTIYNTSTGYEQGWGGVISTNASSSNAFGSTIFYIPNYTSSNQKSYSVDSVGENNASSGWLSFNAALNSTTSAITGLQFFAGNGSLVQYSTFYLYGIKNS